MSEKTGRDRTRQYRDQKRASGFREATIWLDPETRELIDGEIEAGRFKNLSEAIGTAANRFFKERTHSMT